MNFFSGESYEDGSINITSSAPCFEPLTCFLLSWLLPSACSCRSFTVPKVIQILQVSRYKKISFQHLFKMRSLILLALAPLALANDLSKRSVVSPRQGSDAFKPIPIPQSNCQYPCGETWCLIPSRGDTCCAEGCKRTQPTTQKNPSRPPLLAGAQ